MDKLVIATRGSKLALWQSNHIKEKLQQLHPDLEIELKVFTTEGDKRLDTSLALIGGKGLFVKELEDAILRGEAHIAVNSLKDMPFQIPEGLKLSAITKREDVRDVLLSDKYDDVESLPFGTTIGTSSLRRTMQLLALRPDLNIKPLRGNIDTRIEKLKKGEFDAIILASAGIDRLGLHNSVQNVYTILVSEIIPAMGQGALGIETIDDPEVEKLVSPLNDEVAMVETTVERDFVKELDGGCTAPIGINATLLENDTIIVKAVLGTPDGSEVLRDTIVGNKSEYQTLGKKLADKMRERGAVELLQKATAMLEEKNDS
ncbi:MAG TPA: hydroxymethylbilane synthase [Campylobacterales bacterium]|nr:hydroxymethylbilane synthase [Campylobacterales bacterium]